MIYVRTQMKEKQTQIFEAATIDWVSKIGRIANIFIIFVLYSFINLMIGFQFASETLNEVVHLKMKVLLAVT